MFARRPIELAPNWRNAVLLVKPATILRWHREGFRLLWRRRSRPRNPAGPKISQQAIELIRRMAKENKTWGAERIRGELLKLGTRFRRERSNAMFVAFTRRATGKAGEHSCETTPSGPVTSCRSTTSGFDPCSGSSSLT